MSTYYDLYENPDIQQTGEKQPLHPRVVSKGTIDQDEFLDRVSKFTGLSRSLLSGAMQSFYTELRDLLSEGWAVELGDIGLFSTSLQCPPVMTKKEINAVSVSLKNINYRAGNQLKREVGHQMRLERADSSGRPKGKALSKASCLQLLREYLEKYPCISRSQYSELTGRNKRKAVEELNLFIEQGILLKHGMGKFVVYIKAAQPKG